MLAQLPPALLTAVARFCLGTTAHVALLPFSQAKPGSPGKQHRQKRLLNCHLTWREAAQSFELLLHDKYSV